MKRAISIMLGAAGLLALGGCASTVYLDMVRKEPDERPSVVTDDFCKERWVQPCFAVTAMDFSAFGRVSENAAGKGGHMGSPFWLPVVFLDVPFSLCTDVVTMPWQIARYRRFTSDDIEAPRSAMVPELLRGIRECQHADGHVESYDTVSTLVDTSLTVLSVFRSFHHPLSSGAVVDDDADFALMSQRGIEYLVSCADTSGATVRLKGEESESRAVPIAADAFVCAYSYTLNPRLREIAEKCVARVVEEVASIGADAAIDETTAGKLRWSVMTLQDAKDARLDVADLNARLENAKSILARYGKGDNGYYDVWKEYRKNFVDGPPDDGMRWRDLRRTRREAVGESICVGEIAKDGNGNNRWASGLFSSKGSPVYSGLGHVADAALVVLQISWPASHRCPPRRSMDATREGDGAASSDGEWVDI